MAIVTKMRSASGFIAALLVSLLAVVIVAPVQAASVTDQYTEELPKPEGPGKQSKPNNPGEKTNSETGNNGSGNSETGQSGSYATSSGSGSGTSTDTSSGTGQSGSNDKNSGKDKADGKSKKKAGKADGSDEDDKSSFAAVSPSGGDGGDGMGLIFPAAIIVVAGLVGGFVYLKRNRGSLAT